MKGPLSVIAEQSVDVVMYRGWSMKLKHMVLNHYS